MAKSAAAVAAKWVRGMQGASETAKEGAMSVTVAPGIRAAEQAGFWIQKLQEAFASGRFQEAVAAVPLQKWQQDYITKGISAMTSRAPGAKLEVERFQQFWQPIVEESKRMVASMPKGGPELAKARMLANFDNLVGRKYKGRR